MRYNIYSKSVFGIKYIQQNVCVCVWEWEGWCKQGQKKWEKNPIQKKSSTLEKCNIGLVHNLREKSFSFFISDSFQQTHSSHFQLLLLEILMMFMVILFWCGWLLLGVSGGGVTWKALKKFNNFWKLWSLETSL